MKRRVVTTCKVETSVSIDNNCCKYLVTYMIHVFIAPVNDWKTTDTCPLANGAVAIL